MSASVETDPGEERPRRPALRGVALIAAGTVVAMVAAVLIALPGDAEPHHELPSLEAQTVESDDDQPPRAEVSVDAEVPLTSVEAAADDVEDDEHATTRLSARTRFGRVVELDPDTLSDNDLRLLATIGRGVDRDGTTDADDAGTVGRQQ